jgi:restriction system protein
MAVWVVRAGGSGEYEELALEKGLVAIGWSELGDLSNVKSQEELKELCNKTYPDAKTKTIQAWASQLWSFIDRIKVDELVILPLKTRSAIAVGEVKGEYKYRPDLPERAQHTRKVHWLRDDIPRSAFDQDLLYSFGAYLTVGRVRREKAEERIRAVLEGRKPSVPEVPGEEPEEEAEVPRDLEEFARDQVMTYIGRKFKGHELSRLVTSLLEAQGYKTQMSSPGADGGVDIIAGRGPMGFDNPKLCVQVKSSDDPVDVKVLRELQGVMKNYGAEQGLLVAWGGFKKSVTSEAGRLFFEIRLWDSGDLVDVLLENYERLPEDLKAELPLKRIWTLVPEE